MKNKFVLSVLIVFAVAPSIRVRAQTVGLDYSTYFGGNKCDEGKAIAVDTTGAVYIAGVTFSFNFPTSGPYQSSIQAAAGPSWYADAFVSKLSSTGSEVIYSTYLGGGQGDSCNALSVENGCAYVAGNTASRNFPTENPYQASKGRDIDTTEDAFICKLSSTGSALLYSTYLGGWFTDQGGAISVASGCAYVAGWTYSTDFPVVNAYQAAKGESSAAYHDAFVAKLAASGSDLIYSTYLGGSHNDAGQGIAVDGGVFACVVGWTESSDLPVTGFACQTASAGNIDAFLSKLSSTGAALEYSSYLGGSDDDGGYGIAVENAQPCLTGYTTSPDFPTVNPYQASWNEATNGYGDPIADVFVARLSSGGSALLYSTYLGGNDVDRGCGVVVDAGSTQVVGYTSSTDFPVQSAYQSSAAGSDEVFLSCLSSSGSALAYSTYLGGTGRDWGLGIAGEGGYVYVTGYTESGNFPTRGPYQASFDGALNDGDAFIGKLYVQTPTSLAFVVQPSETGAGGVISPPVEVAILDQYGETITAATGVVVMSIQTNPGGGTLFGTTAKSAVNGVATFDDLGIDRPGSGYTLRAMTTPLPVTNSDPFNITASPSPTPTLGAPTPPPPTPVPTATPPPSAAPSAPIPTPTPALTPSSLQRLVLGSGDYNGDGTSDIAVFRGSAGMWSVRGITRAYFGSSSDLPVPGDYDGDGTAEIGIFRGSSGFWGIRGVTRVYYGSASDIPVPGDYDGDGSCDIGVFRGSGGLWAIVGVTRAYFGGAGDGAVPGDYGGDGTADIALFRGSGGMWAIQGRPRIYYGSSGDTAVPGDYNGDGTWEAGIFRPGTGMWGIRGVTRAYYGSGSDRPVPADYDGNGADEAGIFRAFSGLWGIRNFSRVYFGSSGDIPVTR